MPAEPMEERAIRAAAKAMGASEADLHTFTRAILDGCAARVSELEAELDRKNTALWNYGQHGDDCNKLLAWGAGPHACDCGLAEALDGPAQGPDLEEL